MIVLSNICKEYTISKKNVVTALTNVSLKIEKGEFVSIIGKSGSGKTTLLNIISCLDNPTQGEYLLNKENVNTKNDKELSEIRNSNFGFIFQNFNLSQKLNAYENIEMPLIYQKVNKKTRKLKINEYAKKLGIENRLQHKPNELSGGEQQRVAIARALVTDANIIIADEPTGALDQKTGKEIMAILKQLNKEGKTIILVTHDYELAKEATKIISIIDGKIGEINDNNRNF